MSGDRLDDSIADQLEETRWDYSQRDDRRFLLDPIGRIFKTFCWDGRPPSVRLPQPTSSADDEIDAESTDHE